MSGARVQNVDALKHFRVALWKFAELATVAMGDAEGEVQRTCSWLAGEQQQYWQGQIRKRHELVNRCKDAVRQKQIFKDSSGRQQSAVDEQKALAIAQKRLDEAEQKLIATRRHSGKMQKELHMYKGAVQAFSTAIASDLPNAVATLDRMVHSLEAYLSLTAAASEAMDPAASAPAAVGFGDGPAALPTEGEELATGQEPAATDAGAEAAPDSATNVTAAPSASGDNPPASEAPTESMPQPAQTSNEQPATIHSTQP